MFLISLDVSFHFIFVLLFWSLCSSIAITCRPIQALLGVKTGDFLINGFHSHRHVTSLFSVNEIMNLLTNVLKPKICNDIAAVYCYLLAVIVILCYVANFIMTFGDSENFREPY